MMKIFLFDMDGVLLESHGYHLALQETVHRMALALGFRTPNKTALAAVPGGEDPVLSGVLLGTLREAGLSAETIATFEAGGITSEWDEAAICTACLLEAAWKNDPGLAFPLSLAGPAASASPGRLLPDFMEAARALTTAEMLPLHPLERAARLFLKKHHHDPRQEQILHDLILQARWAEVSLTHRTFQELVLGSAEFARAYDLPAELDCESYLLKYDRSNLSAAESQRLRDWLAAPGQAAVVITSRPSRAPAGIFSTPEAELGTKLVGLEGLPVLGWGGMCWLGLQRYTNPQSFLKPSPVHALAGIRMALGESQETALSAAAELVDGKKSDGGWPRLEGARVTVFEDTPGGVKSLLAAKEALGRVGVQIEARYCGVAREPVKVTALEACGAKVFPSVTEALEAAFASG